jgi:hypothetical protein
MMARMNVIEKEAERYCTMTHLTCTHEVLRQYVEHIEDVQYLALLGESWSSSTLSLQLGITRVRVEIWFH